MRALGGIHRLEYESINLFAHLPPTDSQVNNQKIKNIQDFHLIQHKKVQVIGQWFNSASATIYLVCHDLLSLI